MSKNKEKKTNLQNCSLILLKDRLRQVGSVYKMITMGI